MDFETYTKHVLRTVNKDLTEKELLCMAVMGMCGELGELYELVHADKVVDVTKSVLIEKEAGDFLWYFALLTHTTGCTDVSESPTMFIEGDAVESLQNLSQDVFTATDIIKKHVFHNKPINFSSGSDWHRLVYLIFERFKVFTALNNVGLQQVMQTNVNKLIARYPDGFDVERANNRAKGDT